MNFYKLECVFRDWGVDIFFNFLRLRIIWLKIYIC